MAPSPKKKQVTQRDFNISPCGIVKPDLRLDPVVLPSSPPGLIKANSTPTDIRYRKGEIVSSSDSWNSSKFDISINTSSSDSEDSQHPTPVCETPVFEPIKTTDTYESEETAFTYKVDDDGVLILPPNKEVFLHGLVNITVLQGNVEVFGSLLEKHKEYDLYSPRGSAYLYLKNVPTTNSPISNQKNIELKKLNVKHNFSHMDAVCICKPINNTKIQFLEKHVSQVLFPSNENRYTFKSILTGGSMFKQSYLWNQTLKQLKHPKGHFEKLMICGGKGVGKSTYLRYACNTLLKNYKEVLVIDLDPGQSEFTIPCCVSAVIVKEPIFGPNYTHITKPEFSVFCGEINVAKSAHHYLKCVQVLEEYCRSFPQMPVLINTMGFTRGIGMEIMVSVLHILQPDRVVEIVGAPQKNFPENLDFENINPREEIFGYKGKLKSYTVLRVDSMSGNGKGFEMQPRQIREFCILAYIAQALPEHVLSLTDVAVPLFETNLDAIENLKCQSEFAVILGQLVGLCTKIRNDIFQCHGWGIVRAVDFERNSLAIITPLDLDSNDDINYLLKASITLPPSIYMTEDGVNSGTIPFVAQGVLSNFNQLSKRSYMPAKKPNLLQT